MYIVAFSNPPTLSSIYWIHTAFEPDRGQCCPTYPGSRPNSVALSFDLDRTISAARGFSEKSEASSYVSGCVLFCPRRMKKGFPIVIAPELSFVRILFPPFQRYSGYRTLARRSQIGLWSNRSVKIILRLCVRHGGTECGVSPDRR